MREATTKHRLGDWRGESLRVAAPGGRLISLEEAQRSRRGSAVRPLNPLERGNLILWPWSPEPGPEDEADRPLRRRRLTAFQRWLPTLAFVGGLVALILAGFAAGAILGSLRSTPSPPRAEAPALTVPAAPGSAEQPLAASPRIRFTVRVLEPAYTVVAGDTLSTIAQRYTTTVAALRGINNLSDNAILSVGQRLVVH